jgi:hypothetical protein
MITHSYEHTYVHPNSMSTFKRLDWLDLEIHKVGHEERLVIDEDVAYH